MNTQPNTAGSTATLPRGLAPLSGGCNRRRRPRPYPARVRLTPPYTVTDGVIERCLTPHESILLFAVMGDGPVSASEIIEKIWPDPDLEPDCARSSLSRHIHDLREKIEPFGWQIDTRPTRGFHLERVP